ncbi:MAG: hypothetical protein Q9187_007304 [Circinaria calcarea]
MSLLQTLSLRSTGLFAAYLQPFSRITHNLPLVLPGNCGRVDRTAASSRLIQYCYVHSGPKAGKSFESAWKSSSTVLETKNEVETRNPQLQSCWTPSQPTISTVKTIRRKETQREPDAEIQEVYNRLGLHHTASYGNLWSAVGKDEKKALPRLSKGQRLAVLNRILIIPEHNKAWNGNDGILRVLGLSGTVTVDQLMTAVDNDTRRREPRLSNQQRKAVGWQDVLANRVPRWKRILQCCGYVLAVVVVCDMVDFVTKMCTHDEAARKLGM